jgi:hypothetical protein
VNKGRLCLRLNNLKAVAWGRTDPGNSYRLRDPPVSVVDNLYSRRWAHEAVSFFVAVRTRPGLEGSRPRYSLVSRFSESFAVALNGERVLSVPRAEEELMRAEIVWHLLSL